VLIGAVGAHLAPQFLVEAALGFFETPGAVAPDRPRLLRALLFKPALGFTQPRPAALAGAQLLGQLVAARVAVELVFGGIDRLGLLEDLARELLVVAVRVATRVRRDLRAVDRDDADLGQALLRAQREDLTEQTGDRVLVALDEPRDRCVIRPLLSGHDPERDVLLAALLDQARRPDPARVGIEQQRHHHRRVIGRSAAPVAAVSRVERLEVHLADGVDDEPCKVLLRQPLPHVGRHQKRLLAIARDKALAHHGIVLNPPDDTLTYATASWRSRSLHLRFRFVLCGANGRGTPELAVRRKRHRIGPWDPPKPECPVA
jgi:hypothetical protein